MVYNFQNFWRQNQTIKKKRIWKSFLIRKKNSLITNNFFHKRKSVWMSHEDAVIKLPREF